MTELQGKWVWYELMTGDPAGAKAFYEAVVGWQITLGTEAPMHYGFIANDDGQMTAGLLPLTADMATHGADPMWLGYIGVDDCDTAVAAITASGGKVLMPATDIADVGRFALCADPDGMPFYVMTPVMPVDGSGGSTAFDRGMPGRCGWNELLAPDAATALTFYTSLFGWTLPEPMDMGPMGKYQFIDHGAEPIGAIMPKPAQAPHGGWRFYFRVNDIDKAAATAKALGGQVLMDPMQVPTGEWVCNGVDPQGAAFALVGSRPSAAV